MENTKPWFSCRALCLMNDALGWPVEDCSLLHSTLWGIVNPYPFLRAAFGCSWPLPKTFAVTCTLPIAIGFGWWTALLLQPHRKALKWLQSSHHKGLSKMYFPVIARATVALFQVLPCQTRVCERKNTQVSKALQPEERVCQNLSQANWSTRCSHKWVAVLCASD